MSERPWTLPRFVGVFAAALLAALGPGCAEESDLSWDERIEVASGDGYRGPWRMNDSRFLYVDDPTVDIGADGAIGVAWVDQARKDVFFRLYGPDGEPTTEEPVPVSKSPRIFSWLPRVVVGPGEPAPVFVLWQEIVFSGGTHGGEIFFARSTDGGRSFERPTNLSGSRAGDGKGRLTEKLWHNGSLDLALGPEGTLYAAWTEYEGKLWLARSTDGGKTFSDPLRIAGVGDTLPARGPSLAVADEETVHLAWTVGEDPAADVRLATSADGGETFGESRIAAPTGGHADAAKIGVDESGAVHLVFAESPDGPFRRSRVLYSRWDGTKEGWFDEPREPSAPHGERFASVSFPSLAVAEGLVAIVWELYASSRQPRPRGLGFTYSTTGGRTFVAPSVVPGTTDPARGVDGSQQGLLLEKLALGSEGRIAVVNSTFDEGEESRVWLVLGRILDGDSP